MLHVNARGCAVNDTICCCCGVVFVVRRLWREIEDDDESRAQGGSLKARELRFVLTGTAEAGGWLES